MDRTDDTHPRSTRRRRAVVFGEADVSDFDDARSARPSPCPCNMGPSHPAMHGTVRIVLEVEGEKIKSADIQIGYLHRCFEKEAENATWTQIFPYTDRLNYVSPMLNNVGYAMAVEKLLDIDDKIPERAQYIRVIVGEISRITDHLTCLAAGAMELGAFTVFFYLIKAREWLWELLEEVSGARLTHSYVRIGGVVADLPEGLAAKLRDDARQRTRSADRRRGQAAHQQQDLPRPHGRRRRCITKEDAIAWGLTGPVGALDRASPTTCARITPTWSTTVSTSTCRSARRATTSTATPVRVEEIYQSMRILEQALEQIPPGRFMHRRSARGAARQARDVQHHRGDDRPLQADHGRHARPAGRGVFVHRGRQRRARLLHRLRRDRPALEVPRAPALLSPTWPS